MNPTVLASDKSPVNRASQLTIRSASVDVDELGDEAGIDASTRAAELANLDLFSRIDQALRTTGYSPLSNLHILAAAGIVVLRGAIPSYYMKQIAQAAVAGIPGIREVHNLLEVVPRNT
jgi:osmotically-inducible protein OsmY